MIRAALLAIAIAAPAHAWAPPPPAEQQVNAAAVEWFVAHCDPAPLTGEDLFWLAMVVGASAPETMAAARAQWRAELEEGFEDAADACDHLGLWIRGE